MQVSMFTIVGPTFSFEGVLHPYTSFINMEASGKNAYIQTSVYVDDYGTNFEDFLHPTRFFNMDAWGKNACFHNSTHVHDFGISFHPKKLHKINQNPRIWVLFM